MSDADDSSDDGNIEIEDEEKVKLIQYMMLHRLVTKQSLINAYTSLHVDDPNAENLTDTLTTMNSMLQGSNLKISTTRCEVSGKPFYILTSTNYIPGKVWPTSVYSDSQIDYIRCLVHNIVISNSGTASQSACMEIESKLPKNDVPGFLKLLVSHKWLIQPREGIFALSALLMTELESYIQQVYKDMLSKCMFCKRTMFYGTGCDSCDKRGHFRCFKMYRNSLKNGPVKCPSCNKNWKLSNYNSFTEIEDEPMDM